MREFYFYLLHISFKFMVLRLGFIVFTIQCKHQLAARLAASTGTCIHVKVSDDELALLLSNL